MGGEPARVAACYERSAHDRGPGGITLEAVISRLVLIVVAAWLIWQYAPPGG